MTKANKVRDDLIVRFMSGIYGFSLKQSQLIADFILARDKKIVEPLVKGLDDIARGMIPNLPSLSDPDFRGKMWGWSQEKAKETLTNAGVEV